MLKINYKKFMKHAEKVTKGLPDTRPILKGVNHDDNGTLTVTDSHRLYQAHNVNAPKNAVLDAVTGEPIEGNYPDTYRLIPYKDDAKATLYIPDVGVLVKVLKSMQQAAMVGGIKKGNTFLTINRDGIKVDTMEEITFTFNLPVDNPDELEETTISLQYVLEAFEMLADMGAIDATLYWYGVTKPLTINPEGSDDILALILPVRKY